MTDDPCLIRPFGGLDLDRAAALHGQCFPAVWEQRWDRQDFAELLAMPGAFGLMAETRDGETVGLVLVRTASDEAEILTVGVVPHARRLGVGTHLLQSAAAEAASRGARRVFLEVAEDNFPARRLYGDLGFRPVGRRAGYYGRGPLDRVAALVLARDVSPEQTV